MTVKKGSPEHALRVAKTLEELSVDEGGVLHGHFNVHAAEHCGWALAYWRLAESERDEARREAEKWRHWAHHAPAALPTDGRFPWEREGGDDE